MFGFGFGSGRCLESLGSGARAPLVPTAHTAPSSSCSYLRDHARTIAGRDQLFFTAAARALEGIPRALATNSGLDATDVLNRLRQAHAAADGGGRNIGVDVHGGGVCDTLAAFVWEPALVKVGGREGEGGEGGEGGERVVFFSLALGAPSSHAPAPPPFFPPPPPPRSTPSRPRPRPPPSS